MGFRCHTMAGWCIHTHTDTRQKKCTRWEPFNSRFESSIHWCDCDGGAAADGDKRTNKATTWIKCAVAVTERKKKTVRELPLSLRITIVLRTGSRACNNFPTLASQTRSKKLAPLRRWHSVAWNRNNEKSETFKWIIWCRRFYMIPQWWQYETIYFFFLPSWLPLRSFDFFSVFVGVLSSELCIISFVNRYRRWLSDGCTIWLVTNPI